MPMGRKIRHYEKQKALPPFPFLFFPNRFTSMRGKKKKVREKSSRLYDVYSKKGGRHGGKTVELGFRSHELIRIFLNLTHTHTHTHKYHNLPGKISFSKQVFLKRVAMPVTLQDLHF